MLSVTGAAPMVERLALHSSSLAQSMAFQSRGAWTFVRSLLRDPVGIGAVVPSSPRLSRLIASQVDSSTSTVLEVGAGTGSVTDAVLNRGIDPQRVLVIERDPHLAAYLRDRFPRLRVRCGDAVHASSILSKEAVREVDTLLSSLPIRNLSPEDRITTIGAMLKALAPKGQLIQYTYGGSCPFPIATLGLKAECLGRVWLNVPPATVWRFTRRAAA